VRGGKGTALALAVAFAVLSVPASAAAVDSDLKHAFAFKVEASNGYSILAYAANERADGRGEIVLFVSGRNGGATYLAPAQLSATSIEADLGPLGAVSLEVVPSGKEKTERSACKGEGESFRFEPQAFRGRFEFHGEDGFADAVSTAPRERTRFFVDLLCASNESEGQFGHSPGARLQVHRTGSHGFQFQAQANSPTRPTRFEATIRERHGRMRVERSARAIAGPKAFRFDFAFHELEPPFPAASAVVKPPAPFAGTGFFQHEPGVPSSWHGDLSVDFPGRSDVRLAGPGARATMVRAVLNPSHPFRIP
jgi:hypothetical protein